MKKIASRVRAVSECGCFAVGPPFTLSVDNRNPFKPLKKVFGKVEDLAKCEIRDIGGCRFQSTIYEVRLMAINRRIPTIEDAWTTIVCEASEFLGARFRPLEGTGCEPLMTMFPEHGQSIICAGKEYIGPGGESMAATIDAVWGRRSTYDFYHFGTDPRTPEQLLWAVVE
jgi:hypothetical protein